MPQQEEINKVPRVKRGTKARQRRKKVLKAAKGFRGGRSKLYRTAADAVMKALSYAYRDRRTRKREMRKLWIVRINAASRQFGMSYSLFMNGLSRAGVNVNRKMLAELAVNDITAFGKLVDVAKQQTVTS